MFTVQKSGTRRAVRVWTGFLAVAAFCAGIVLKTQAQPAPPNNNLTNAQVILGPSGSQPGTNLYALYIAGDPAPVPGVSAQSASTIWYAWTAPTTGWIDFNTRGSTDTNGITLDTVLSVYKLKAGAAALTYGNLANVVYNEDDPSGGVTSRVDFNATIGTTYYIQVGSTTNISDNCGQGYPHLNWGSSLLAGGFGFSATIFPLGSMENWLPDSDGSIGPSLYGFPQGTANARITVTRSGGYTGRCEVTLILGDAYYTNIYETNYLVTNSYVTNYSTNAPTVPTSFTNTYLTNIAWINNFQNYEFQNNPPWVFLAVDGDEEVTLTNANGFVVGPNTFPTILAGTTTYGLPNFFTNFPCPRDLPPFPPEWSTNWTTNADVITVMWTNIECSLKSAIALVPAALPGITYSPFAVTLTFDDFQMSEDIGIQLYPILNTVNNGGERPNTEAVQDFVTPGPEDLGFSPNADYFYGGLNGALLLTLTNLQLDPLENPDIIAPAILQTNAFVNILNYWGNPLLTFSNYFADGVDIINIERQTYRCNKNCGTAVVFVQQTLRGIDESPTIHYTIDSKHLNLTAFDDNGFATVADSDFAVPSNSVTQTDFDFLPPVPNGGVTWNGIPGTWGQISFPALTLDPQRILIPIVTNGAVEFDEDIEVQLFYQPPGEQSSDNSLTPTPAFLGSLNNSRLTINFDNIVGSVQPGGAVDRTYNVDDQNDSQPPQNTLPGANQAVNAVAIQANGMVVIGGDFDSFNSYSINYIARLLANGQMDFSFTNGLGRGPNGFVNAIVIDSSSRIIIGGEFTAVNGTNAYYIARLNYDGSLDTNLATGFGFNGAVHALAIDANGNILAGGEFTSYNKTNCNHIARLLPSGGLDTNFLPSAGTSATSGAGGTVRAVTTDSFGNVILGGDFVTVNGTNWNHIARLLPNGTLDTTFNPGIGADGSVLALAVRPDNAIILGGAFHSFNLISRNYIARLTSGGVLDTSFEPGTGFDDIVYSLVLQPDGNVLVGGQFTMYNTSRRVAAARLLSSGWLDTSYMDTAYSQFAGLINHYYNTNAYNPNDFPSSYNYRNQILAMGLQADGNIVIGGQFLRVGGGFGRTDIHSHMNVARLIGPATPGPEEGGIGNCPGNIGLTQNPYSVDDHAGKLFVTLDRQNGSQGPARITLSTNTLPPSSSSATSADFGLSTATALYDTVHDLAGVGPATYGWRKADGEYGFNNNIQTVFDNGESYLFLSVNNDPSAAPIIYADMSLLNITATNLLSLGGVPIPLWPALAQYDAQLNIINDNFPAGTLGLSASNYNVLESAGSITIPILRTNGSYGTVSVLVNTKDGTARVAGNDYVGLTNDQVIFYGSQTSNSVTITIYDHNTQQSNKFFYVYLSGTNGGATLDTNVPPLVWSNSTVWIIDDHFQPGYLSFGSPTYSVLKPGEAAVSVVRTGAALGQVSVQVGTSNGTAINGVNYVSLPTNTTLTWTNQDISTKTVMVQTLQDNTVEGPKTVDLFLYNPQVAGNQSQLTNAEVLTSPSNAVLTIQDTDSYGSLNFLVSDFNILQNGGAAIITVVRTGGTVGSVSVNFATYTPTNVVLPYLAAVAGTSYSATNGVLTFGPRVSAQSFTVPVLSTPNESQIADRIVGLQLFSASPTNIAAQFPKTAILTILDPQLHDVPAGSVDTTTLNGTGFNNFVYSLSLQPDQSILAGGDFSYFNGYPFSYAARLLASANYDTGFLFNLAGPNGPVWQVLSQAPASGQVDGNIMIVGDFSQVDLVNSAGIARLNLNGGLDTSFNPGSGADSTVYTVIQMSLPTPTSSTNLTNVAYYVIGGSFANFDGTPSSGVARLTPAGLIDPNFNLGLGVTGSNGTVYCLAITAANQILAGGDFTSFDNATHHHLVRLNVDGTMDTNFTAFDGLLSDINGSVRAVVVQPDGRILIGGLFTMVSGLNFNYIARLNSDGSVDTNFNVGVGCNNNVEAIALDDQLRILVGGSFTRASGVTRNGITRLNPDGTVDPTINFGAGANGFVDTIVIQTNDEINIGGGFSSFNNIPEGNFVRVYGGANYGNGSLQFAQQTYGVLESGTNAVISIQRLGGEGIVGQPPVSAVFFTSDGTALSGRDYRGVTNTVTFPLGETFESVLVPVIGNTVVGPDLTVNLSLTNAISTNTEAIGPQVNATLIITNVNTGVEFSAQGYVQTADAPSGYASIPIIRVGNPNTQFTVTVYTGTNGTAGPNINYVPETNVLTFYSNVMTAYFLVPVLNSPTTFADTWVDLEMNDATNAIIASPSSATLTIESVLTGPGFLTFSQPSYTVSEGGTNAVITILRTNGSAGTVTVNLSTSNGTAIAGVNYLSINDQLTFFDGQIVATDNVPVIQLTYAEPDTTLYLNLANPGNGAATSGPTTVPLTIQNDIANFAFSSSSYFVTEGAGSVTLTVLRSGPTNTTASVSYTTYSPTNAANSNGYAVPNLDYTPTSGILSFPPGETLETIPVTILQTANVNGIETFQALLQNPSSGTQIGIPGTATVGIVSDVSGFAFATSNYFVGENGASVAITVNRLNPNTGSLSVHFATTNNATNTAVSGVDYVATNGTLNFLNGQASATFNVQILNPNLVENNKTFNIALSKPSIHSYVVSPSTTVVTITNVYIGFSFGSPSFTVSECSVAAVVPVILTGLTDTGASVQFSTSDGSGVAGVNYFATNGNLVFSPGQTVAYFDVAPINNHVIGPDHTVILNLTTNIGSPPAGVAGLQLLTPSTAILTIQECNGAYIVASGTAFVTGNINPATGVIFSNETVTLLFGLRDIAGGNTTNLVALLQLTNGISTTGVASPVVSNSYGVLIQNGPTVPRPFTFKAVGTNGQNITATLALADGSRNLGTVAFGFTQGGTLNSFSETNIILLPENPTPPTIASVYPSTISVAGISGVITKAAFTISNFGHSYPSDVDIVVEAPNGANSILMSHCGGSTNVSGLTFTFDPAATVSMPLVNKLTNGTYLPTISSVQMPSLPPVPTNEVVSVAPPESPYPYAANLSTFLGASPNGTWSLWAICDKTQDSGVISNGWVLNLSTGVAVENDSDLEVTITPLPSEATAGNLLTYLVAVTNFGPSGATNVVITDYLPPTNVAAYSNLCNCGTLSNDVALTVSLPSLAVGAGTAFNVGVIPLSLGYITNAVTALALEPDPNTNNMVTNIDLISPPSADIGVSLNGGPNPTLIGEDVTFSIEVTNGGPSDASNVIATAILPPGFLPLTNGITPSVGTASNVYGTITWNIGNLAASSTGTGPTLTVVTEATSVGIGTCSVSAGSSVFDPFKGNNNAAIKIEVDQTLLSVVGPSPSYQLTWSALATNFVLQTATNLQGPWLDVAQPPTNGSMYVFPLPISNGNHFFRLKTQ